MPVIHCIYPLYSSGGQNTRLWNHWRRLLARLLPGTETRYTNVDVATPTLNCWSVRDAKYI
jgi:hypothetical protein